jgi:hypothetical protein
MPDDAQVLLQKALVADRLCLAVVMPTSLDECLTRNARRSSGRAIREAKVRCMHATIFETPNPEREPDLVFTNPQACLNATNRGVGSWPPHFDTGIEPFVTLHH